jgi:hypothetical protein
MGLRCTGRRGPGERRGDRELEVLAVGLPDGVGPDDADGVGPRRAVLVLQGERLAVGILARPGGDEPERSFGPPTATAASRRGEGPGEVRRRGGRRGQAIPYGRRIGESGPDGAPPEAVTTLSGAG